MAATLSIADAQDIHAAYQYRREHFATEDSETSMLVVLLNHGSHLTPVSCIAGEWSGVKGDLTPGPGVPTCPNGHVCTEGPGVRLGFVSEGGA